MALPGPDLPPSRAAGPPPRAPGARFDTEPALIADMGDHELWMPFFKESEGNQLALVSEIPATRAEARDGDARAPAPGP